MKTLLTRIQDTFPLPEETVIPFREAEICYRAGAYRAALLFSYIGWGLTLRSRLLRAACPAGIPLEKWEKDIANLRREDEWDRKVFDLTQQKTPAPVFLVSEDLRHQVRYWKDRRNDCAHFKANEIDHSHVESFWNFIFSNMGKFVPNGSAAALLNEIVLHFDQDVTPPNTPLDPIIERIPHCVERDELTQFFKDVAGKILEELDSVRYYSIPNLRQSLRSEISQRVNQVFAAVIRITNEPTINALRDFLLNNEDCLVNLLREFPQHVTLLAQNPQQVRNLWRKHLFSKRDQNEDTRVFLSLLRADLIPQEEIAEANERAVDGLNGDILSPADFLLLEQCSFFPVFIKKVFADDFHWIIFCGWDSKQTELFFWYFESHTIPREAVRRICSLLSDSFWAKGGHSLRLKRLFKNNPNKRQEFERIVQQENLTLPEGFFGE